MRDFRSFVKCAFSRNGIRFPNQKQLSSHPIEPSEGSQRLPRICQSIQPSKESPINLRNLLRCLTKTFPASQERTGKENHGKNGNDESNDGKKKVVKKRLQLPSIRLQGRKEEEEKGTKSGHYRSIARGGKGGYRKPWERKQKK